MWKVIQLEEIEITPFYQILWNFKIKIDKLISARRPNQEIIDKKREFAV